MSELIRSARRIYQREGTLTLARKTVRWMVGNILSERLLDFWVSKSLSPAGWYEINPTGQKSFEIYSYGSGVAARKRIRGELEPQVMNELTSRASADMHVWDVGAAWGYFTQTIASQGATVTAFEVEKDRCDIVREGARRNGWSDRVKVVEGTVGSDVSLTDFERPDLIKMDIEGWEYDAIQDVLGNLNSKPTWVVEVHEPAMFGEDTPAKSGEKIKELFTSQGYEITELEQRNETNYHIVAEGA